MHLSLPLTKMDYCSWKSFPLRQRRRKSPPSPQATRARGPPYPRAARTLSFTCLVCHTFIPLAVYPADFRSPWGGRGGVHSESYTRKARWEGGEGSGSGSGSVLILHFISKYTRSSLFLLRCDFVVSLSTPNTITVAGLLRQHLPPGEMGLIPKPSEGARQAPAQALPSLRVCGLAARPPQGGDSR